MEDTRLGSVLEHTNRLRLAILMALQYEELTTKVRGQLANMAGQLNVFEGYLTALLQQLREEK